MIELYNDVEKSPIDYAFEGQFVLKMYEYLRVCQVKRPVVEEFMISSTAKEITDIVTELEEYLEGGQDPLHKQLREAYGHIPKPQNRKIKTYLCGILEDAQQYSDDKRVDARRDQRIERFLNKPESWRMN